ncbi:amino acid adenylation domain-containing protein [Gordonia sp. ABSL1-1]|uniref:non-ribosomal peptide synthetase n=1 Tax=Gordonia sp. ABSL1-1 TaxID=3053923 RepID=UPI002572A8EF|nr:amino acid adenylation domain-containing protein [Gordonia sp. ABSL1-1]MDL9938980.1 amino acid adenylation domain-containing protein [Gordonia sp. ABSL1-1]
MTEHHDVRNDVAAALGVAAEDIRDDDDLIALGLDSIRIMKIAGDLRKRGHRLNFAQLAAEPTVAAWSARVAASAADAPEPAAHGTVTEPVPTRQREPMVEAVSEVDAEQSADSTPFPLAPMQHAFWIGRTELADLGGVAAHLYVEFDGAGIDPGRLRSAMARLVELHPMLRARFLPDGTQQFLESPVREPFQEYDLRAAGPDELARELAARRDAKSHQVLDVGSGEVVDLTVTLLPEGRHRIHFDIDMLAADAMSYRLLLADLVALYDGAQPQAAGITYRDYLQHRATHPDPARAADQAWWTQRLPELPLGPTLPSRPDAGSDEHRVVRHHRWIDPESKRALLDGAHGRGVTPAIALAAAFAATIGQWSSDRRFLLNVPLFHREAIHPDVDRISGDFSSSVLIDVDLVPGQNVLELAQAMQKTMHANGSHASYGALEVLRDLGRHRGEQVLAPVVYTSALGLGELFSDDVLTRLGDPSWIISQGPQVVLDAQVTELRGGLLLNWDVRESAFPDGVVADMFARYTGLIDGLIGGDGWDGAALGALPAAQAQVRARVNDTAGPSTKRVLHEEFFARAAREPGRTALVADSGSSTYGALAAQALAVAAALRAAGAQTGDAVLVQVPKGPAQLVATLGVFAAGCVWVPLAYDHPAARRETILTTGGIGHVLGSGLDAGDLPASVTLVDLSTARGFAPALDAPVLPDPEAVAYVLFTSGSTGTPKGVEVPHRAAMNTIDDINDRFEVGEDDRSLTVAALEFDISVYDIFGLYSAGGAVVAVELDDARDPSAWADLLRRHQVSILTCVPSALDMLMTAAEGDPRGLGASLRAALLGGDWVGVDLPGRLHALVPGVRFAGLGGATEIAIHGTVCEIAQPPAHWTSVPFGTPLRNVRCRVVDTAGNDCPDWVTGELWVGGAGVAHGYRNDPERTAERFVTVDGIRWYRTGDLARYWSDGTIEFLGRADHQVKIRGFRVELGEVEGALRSLPQVRHAVAAVVDAGGGVRTLAALIVPGGDLPDQDSLVSQIEQELAAVLPAYMVPTRMETVEAIPLTSNGKSDRRAVTALLAQRASAAEVVAPETALEEALASIVGEVLARPVTEIGVTDDFFAIGGDSVLATTVVARIRDWLDAPHVGVADIFGTKTVRALAHRIDETDERPGRLEQVAAVYLEIAAMDDEAVGAAAID